MSKKKRELTVCEKAESSIYKKYRKTVWAPFINAIKDYKLIEENDCIAVCISGGKDSMLLAKLMQMLQRHSDFPFSVKYLVMDPGYTEGNRRKIIDNAKALEIPTEIFDTDIFGVAFKQSHSPCYLCAKMRRGHLYSEAQKRGCNKIALGHHMSDVIETTVLSMFYGAQLQGMIPKLHSKNYPGMQLIRPLYRINERDIIAWKNYNSLSFLQCACRFTEENDIKAETSKRKEIKELIENLRKTNPNIENSIFNSLHRVYLDTFPGYKSEETLHSFLERFEKQDR